MAGRAVIGAIRSGRPRSPPSLAAVSTLFATSLGSQPVSRLLGPNVLSGLSPDDAAGREEHQHEQCDADHIAKCVTTLRFRSIVPCAQ